MPVSWIAGLPFDGDERGNVSNDGDGADDDLVNDGGADHDGFDDFKFIKDDSSDADRFDVGRYNVDGLNDDVFNDGGFNEDEFDNELGDDGFDRFADGVSNLIMEVSNWSILMVCVFPVCCRWLVKIYTKVWVDDFTN